VGAECESQFDSALDGRAVHHRQRARQSQIDRAGLRIGLGAKRRGGTAEDFAARGQLRMGFEPMTTS